MQRDDKIDGYGERERERERDGKVRENYCITDGMGKFLFFGGERVCGYGLEVAKVVRRESWEWS
jgi:hypothetical protein